MIKLLPKNFPFPKIEMLENILSSEYFGHAHSFYRRLNTSILFDLKGSQILEHFQSYYFYSRISRCWNNQSLLPRFSGNLDGGNHLSIEPRAELIHLWSTRTNQLLLYTRPRRTSLIMKKYRVWMGLGMLQATKIMHFQQNTSAQMV